MKVRGRVLELDGVRGLAILMVLFIHGFASSMVAAPFPWSGFPQWVESLSSLGWMGVDLFFVLSGFLITGILMDSVGKPHHFRDFYARRALRILPLYYLLLIFIGVLNRGSGGYVLLGVFYLTNLAPIFGVASVYGTLWSLSVEEHFYLVWPWLVFRLKVNGIAILAASICLVEPIARALAYNRWPGAAGDPSNLSLYSWFRFDGLAAGALLATFVRSRRFSRVHLHSHGLLAAGAAVLLAALIPPGTRLEFSLLYTCSTLFGVALVCLVLAGELPLLGRVARSKWLVKCGELSYCLYIIHLTVFRCVWDAIGGEFPHWLVSAIGPFGTVCVRALVVYTVCFTLAEVSRRYFEGPILKLKRYFALSESRPARATGGTAEHMGTEPASSA